MAKRKKDPEPEAPPLSVMDRILAKMEAGIPLWHFHPCPSCKGRWRCGDDEGHCDPVCPFCGQKVKTLEIQHGGEAFNPSAGGLDEPPDLEDAPAKPLVKSRKKVA